MISPSYFYQTLQKQGVDFFSGVPDSLLKNLCAYITDHSDRKNHIIAANEGAAVGLAAGYHLATGKIPVVYMQNSGLGNTVNPLLSLTDKEVYNIPVLLLIGWRGEPGIKDEPQHVKQGKVTLPLLEAMNIKTEVLVEEEDCLEGQISRCFSYMNETGEPCALIVRKGSFSEYELSVSPESVLSLSREEAVRLVAGGLSKEDIVVSTTGMISRELFEYRESVREGHERDFLTVGSMGHASQIALGLALNASHRKVYCFDGDGATIMHMGALGIIGSQSPQNYYHIVFNNGAHDSVGGQPTIGFELNLPGIARHCGYATVLSIDNKEGLQETVQRLPFLPSPVFLEIKVRKGARRDLGRPTVTPVENKRKLMDFLKR
ncbi:phosphonopyruvate decarboxylase [Phocaeicola sp.]